MTISAEIEVPIARSTADVFRHLLAVERYPEWLVDSGIVGVARVDDGDLAEGSRLRIDHRIAGRVAVLDGIVTALDPGRRFAFRASDRDGVTVEADAALAAEGPACRMRWSVRLALPLRFRFFEGAIAPQARAAATADLERFRRLLESVAG